MTLLPRQLISTSINITTPDKPCRVNIEEYLAKRLKKSPPPKKIIKKMKKGRTDEIQRRFLSSLDSETFAT